MAQADYTKLVEGRLTDGEIKLTVRILKAVAEENDQKDPGDRSTMDDVIAAMEENRENFTSNINRIIAALQEDKN